jgi:hypothetical protein
MGPGGLLVRVPNTSRLKNIVTANSNPVQAAVCKSETPILPLSDPDPDVFPIPKLDLNVLFVVLETAFKYS